MPWKPIYGNSEKLNYDLLTVFRIFAEMYSRVNTKSKVLFKRLKSTKFYSRVTQIFSGSGGGSCNGGGPGAQQWGGDLDQGPHRHEGLPGQPRGHSSYHRWDPLFISKHHFAGEAVFSLSSGWGSEHFHWRFTHSSAENPPIYAKWRRRIVLISSLVINTSGMLPNEFQAFYPVVRIESPHPLAQSPAKRVLDPSLWV